MKVSGKDANRFAQAFWVTHGATVLANKGLHSRGDNGKYVKHFFVLFSFFFLI